MPRRKPDEIATTCPYCGVGCGVLVKPAADGMTAEVRGDPEHPSNFGRLCSKGSALGETLTLEERLLYPMKGQQVVSWDSALDEIATRFSETIREHGPDSVAFYVSGQLLTEDYYVANKLMKGFIGSANIDTNSRLCMASSVVGHKRAFGTDTVPGCYEDLETADLIVMVGSNLAWCHPVLHQRILAARQKRGTKLVIIDPRRTATSDDCDLFLPIKPGTDVILFNALFRHLADSHAHDEAFINEHTNGLQDALEAAGNETLKEVAQKTGLGFSDLKIFFDWVTQTERTVTIYSQGVNQSTAGSDKVNAIINGHLVTGRIGKLGSGPFSVTGQPNAMGGREVGGLANQLAVHMDFAPEDVDRVQRFWDSPVIADKPGLKAVDMFDAIAEGKIKALWVMATNPVVSLPNADKVRAAIEACPFVVVSDVVTTADTVKLADISLPARAWGEKSGTVTNSERRISRQRAFLDGPGEARNDWWALAQVAQRMGFSGFDYENPAEIYREYAAMSGFENEDARDFDISAHSEISEADYDALTPYQWPLTKPADDDRGEHRFFADGKFYTKTRKANFIATPYRPAESQPDEKAPFILNTGRVRDHWHTMTRTGKTGRLSAHIAEPFLEINPADARALHIDPASLVEVKNEQASVILRALVTDRVLKGQVFAPMHWTDRYSAKGRVDTLVIPNTDPLSGQPESKHSVVEIMPYKPVWHAFLVSQREISQRVLNQLGYWAAARSGTGWRYECAGSEDLETLLSDLFPEDESLVFYDMQRRKGRALVQNEQLKLFSLASTTGPVQADRNWVASLLGAEINDDLRRQIMAGRPGSGQSTGRTVCSCLGVGSTAIENAIAAGASSVEGIGAATGAGTNCGSCKPEIRTLMKRFQAMKKQAISIAAE